MRAEQHMQKKNTLFFAEMTKWVYEIESDASVETESPNQGNFIHLGKI